VVPLSVFKATPPQSDTWTTRHVFALTATDIWALGLFKVQGVSGYHILKSSDGGLTFNTPVALAPAPIAIYRGFKDSAGTLWLGPADAGYAVPNIWTSTNGGVSFTQTPLPAPPGWVAGQFFSITSICEPSPGTLVAGGRTLGSGRYLVRSTNGGASWTDVTAGISLPVGQDGQQVNDVIALNATTLILTVEGPPNAPTNMKPFRMSTDGGVTFPTEGTYNLQPGVDLVLGINYMIATQLALADDGSVTGVLFNLGGFAFEAWRGVVSGATIAWTRSHRMDTTTPNGCGFMGVVRIGAVTPGLLSGVLGASLVCGTAFIPNPCPQVCPTDPASSALNLITGAVATSFDADGYQGIGFGADGFQKPEALGYQGGSSAGSGALGISRVCGAAFTNNFASQLCTAA
jgi:hypothetical protein